MANDAVRLTLDEKLGLINSRARILGFRRHDLEDAVQEMMLVVLEFEYDPEKSNGATETTALTTVIDRRLKLLKRSQRRYAGLLDRATAHLAAEHQGFEDGPCSEDYSAEDRVANGEVEMVITGMDEEMHQVCRLLMDGQSANAIAERLGMGWQRVARLVATIRERLQAAGLDPADAE